MTNNRTTAAEAMRDYETMNFRRTKADAMSAELMSELDDVLGDYDRRAVYERLWQVLYDNGASWTTDHERAKMGLEPRDEFGWTPSERVAYRRNIREAMLKANAGIFVQRDDTLQGSSLLFPHR